MQLLTYPHATHWELWEGGSNREDKGSGGGREGGDVFASNSIVAQKQLEEILS